MTTRNYILIAVAVLSTAACSRPSTGPMAESEKPVAMNQQPAASTTSETRHYCDAFPDKCRTCPGEPGSCGGEPAAGACCCPNGGGCVGVEWASDCNPACDFYLCSWGYQTEDANGTPEFWCFD